nr:hypothetical protein [Tanacetum cinerariifolium]
TRTVSKSSKSSERIVEDGESDAEDVYDKTETFIASNNPKSGSGIGNKILYERWDETLDEDPYDDKEHIAYDLFEEQMAFCDVLDIKPRGRIR